MLRSVLICSWQNMKDCGSFLFLKKKRERERVKSQGRALGDKEMSHVSRQETGRPEPISRCVSAPSSRMWLLSGDFRAEISDCPCADSLGVRWKIRDLTVKSQARNIPSITHAPSLIMIKCCQKRSIRIPKSIWHQMGAATCRPSLQHLTEWLMGATEARLSPKPKHKQH